MRNQTRALLKIGACLATAFVLWPCRAQTVYVGNSLGTNGAPDANPPLVILGEYGSLGPPASASIILPAGTVQDVKFYGQNYNFTLYALAYSGPGLHTNEQTFQVIASQSFSNSVAAIGIHTLAVTNFSVSVGDLLAFAGTGPYYPQTANDVAQSDATYENTTNPGLFIAIPPGGPGSRFTVGIHPDTNATYEYISDVFKNQGRTYSIGVDVSEPPQTPCGANLGVDVFGSNLVVTWDGGGVLQSSTNLLASNWIAVSRNPQGYYSLPPTGPALFFRVSCPPVALSAGQAGVSLWNPTNLLSAFPLVNVGTALAQNLVVTSLSIPGATLTSPTLPLNLGPLPSGSSIVLNADFSGIQFFPRQSYTLTVEGTYSVNAVTNLFVLDLALPVPPAAGSNMAHSVSVPSNHVTGGGLTNQAPESDIELNPPGPPVPTAPFGAGTPTAHPTGINLTNAFRPLDNSVEIIANQSLGVTDGYPFAEPSGAATGGDVVFVTFNRAEAYSSDGGASFTELYAQYIFPGVAFGIDQIVQYVPGVDLFVWLLEGPGGYILAVSTPARIVASGGTDWTYWNLTAQLFGQPVGTGLDFPDVSVGNNNLYISWDAGDGCPSGCTAGRQVVRTSLAGLQAGGIITIDYTDPGDGGDAWGSHLTQDVQDEIFWAGQKDNHDLRVFSWADNSSFYSWSDIGITTWANNTQNSLTPDGNNWLASAGHGGFPGNAVLGSTLVDNQLWFAWTAGTDSNFPQPPRRDGDAGHKQQLQSDPAGADLERQLRFWLSGAGHLLPRPGGPRLGMGRWGQCRKLCSRILGRLPGL